MGGDPTDEESHAGCIDEWGLAVWSPSGSVGLITGHQLDRRRGRVGYWWCLARRGHRLLYVADWEVRARHGDGLAKGEQLWAEVLCEAPFSQWTIGNETNAVALDHPDDVVTGARGEPTPVASDLEWYAVGSRPMAVDDGYAHDGVVHGAIEIAGEPSLKIEEWPSRRWHRWWSDSAIRWSPAPLPTAMAHADGRAPVLGPDGTVIEYVLTPTGWAVRQPLTVDVE